MLALLALGVAIWSNSFVYAGYDYIGGISDLAFGGEGKKTCDSDGNCAAKFSTGFRSDICKMDEYLVNMLDKSDTLVDMASLGTIDQDCWGMLDWIFYNMSGNVD